MDVHGGLRENIGMATYLHGSITYAKKLKLRFHVGDSNLPERRKLHTRSRKQENVNAHLCLCGPTIDSRTHVVGECKIFKEERDVFRED